jgi:sugar phosphate isomerase/epimerase
LKNQPQKQNKPFVNIPDEYINQYKAFIQEHNLSLEIYFNAQTLDSFTRGEYRLDSPAASPLNIHGPFMDLAPGAVDVKIRKTTLERFHQTIDIAEILKPEIIVFHSGFDKLRYTGFENIWLEGSLIVWKEILERVEPLGIKLAIENIFEEEPSNLKKLVEILNSPYFGLCFDTGHFNVFSKIPLSEWIDSVKPYIFSMHIHDNHGKSDEHLPPGQGRFDFAQLRSLVKRQNIRYTLEIHSPEGVLEGLRWFPSFMS